MGTTFRFTAGEPENIFLADGYQHTDRISIVERASELGLIKIPKLVLKTVLRTLAHGFAIYVFETDS
jgi:hypothetical protein